MIDMALAPTQFGFTFNASTNQNERRQFDEPSVAPSILPPRLIPMVALAQTPRGGNPDAITMAVATRGKPSDPVNIRFETLNDALLASANRSFGMAACWKLLEKIGSNNGNDVDTFIEGLPIELPTSLQRKLDELDTSTEDASDLIIATFNGKLV